MKTRTLHRGRPRVEVLEGRTLLTAGALDTSFGGTGQVTTQLAYNTGSGGGVGLAEGSDV